MFLLHSLTQRLDPFHLLTIGEDGFYAANGVCEGLGNWMLLGAGPV